MSIGFDIISDLNLKPDDEFDWEDKATSLYCIIAGNLSSDLRVIKKALSQLGKYYQGVFYCLGPLEYADATNFYNRTREISKICASSKNTVLFYQHVVLIDSVAVVGVNGWYGTPRTDDVLVNAQIEISKQEDVAYLVNSVKRLQKHIDIKKILVVSGTVPSEKLFFGAPPMVLEDQIPTNTIIPLVDTEHKITHWTYGSHDKTVDNVIDGVNYISNGCFGKKPYWAKRVVI